MSSLLSALILSLTVAGAVALGVFGAYSAVLGVLHAFAYQSRQRSTRPGILVPSQQHASGD